MKSILLILLFFSCYGIKPLRKSQWEVDICYNTKLKKYYWVASSNHEKQVGISSGIVCHPDHADTSITQVKINFKKFAKANRIKNYYFRY